MGGVPQWELSIAWFVAVTLPVLLFFRVSGAHLNPVVTAALAVGRDFPRREVGPYLAAQVTGAFAGSLAVLVALGPGARLGSTYPHGVGVATAFVAEFGFTFLLAFAVFSIARRGPGVGRWRLVLPGAAVGLSTFVIGPLTGSSLNPARSLAPAVLSGTFQDLWLYFVAVPLGALFAVPLARLLDPRHGAKGPPSARSAATATPASGAADGEAF